MTRNVISLEIFIITIISQFGGSAESAQMKMILTTVLNQLSEALWCAITITCFGDQQNDRLPVNNQLLPSGTPPS